MRCAPALLYDRQLIRRRGIRIPRSDRHRLWWQTRREQRRRVRGNAHANAVRRTPPMWRAPFILSSQITEPRAQWCQRTHRRQTEQVGSAHAVRREHERVTRRHARGHDGVAFLDLRPKVVIVEARHENLATVRRHLAWSYRHDLRRRYGSSNFDRRLPPRRPALRARH